MEVGRSLSFAFRNGSGCVEALCHAPCPSCASLCWAYACRAQVMESKARRL